MTLYEILQVSPGASVEVIHAAARLLMRKFHPDDKQTGDAEMFRAVKAASLVLENPAKRTAYDVSIGLKRKKGAKRQTDPANAYPDPYPSAFPAVQFNAEQILRDAIAAAGRAAIDKLVIDNPILADILRGK